MKVLVGCEESQVVCKAFRAKGHEAYSCDLQECSGGHPEWHYQRDVLEVIKIGWDLGIFHPPCTDLALSGAKHFEKKRADGRQQTSINFFLKIVYLAGIHCKSWVIEQPMSIASTFWRKPDLVIQPYRFGDPYQKTTWLWIHNLPKLKATHSDSPLFGESVDKGEFVTTPSGKTLPKWFSDNKDPETRSKTFPGIAAAMAAQWGNLK